METAQFAAKMGLSPSTGRGQAHFSAIAPSPANNVKRAEK